MNNCSPAVPHPKDRDYWVHLLEKIARPILEAGASGDIRQRMPLETSWNNAADRAPYSHLEAVGRTLAGIAPWLEVELPAGQERELQAEFRELSRQMLTLIVRPLPENGLNFSSGDQPVVDAAFLSHALLRAPRELLQFLAPASKRELTARLVEARNCRVSFNNWLLFAAMNEAALLQCGESVDAMRIDYAIRQLDQWFVGDGWYMDGPHFRFDYYNSFVIHPMLLDLLSTVGPLPSFASRGWAALEASAKRRAHRHAVQLERMIAPDGSFPPIGRSLAYRTGAFQLPAQLALQENLPEALPPGQLRSALTAVLRRCFEAPGTFDDEGWLTIGLCGHQASLGEPYISTGSLYLCLTAFLPLGLPPEAPFWSTPNLAWTSARVWSGKEIPLDHAPTE